MQKFVAALNSEQLEKFHSTYVAQLEMQDKDNKNILASMKRKGAATELPYPMAAGENQPAGRLP